MSKLLANHKARLARLTEASEGDESEGPVAAKTSAKSKRAAVSDDDDEDDDDGADKDDDAVVTSPKAKKSAPDVSASSEQVAVNAVAAERKRCGELNGLTATAARLGVSFDASKAISNGMSVEAARTAIMNAAAESDADETPVITAPKPTGAKGGNKTTAESVALWKKAFKSR